MHMILMEEPLPPFTAGVAESSWAPEFAKRRKVALLVATFSALVFEALTWESRTMNRKSAVNVPDVPGIDLGHRRATTPPV